MTHKLLVGAALAVTAAPLLRKYSNSRSSSLSISTSGQQQQREGAAATGMAATARGLVHKASLNLSNGAFDLI